MEDQITKVATLLQASPFKEIADRQQHIKNHFSLIVQSVISKLEQIETRCKELKDNGSKNENIKGMWAWRGILTTGMLGIIGLLIKLLLTQN